MFQHVLKLVGSLLNTLPVERVHHVDQTLGVAEVVMPQRSQNLLTSDVPHREADVAVLDGLHVEADGGDSDNDLAKLQTMEDGGLAGGVEAQKQNPDRLATADEPIQRLQHSGEQQTHDVVDGKTHGKQRGVCSKMR